MANLMESKYDFKKVETDKYDMWLKGGYFTAGDKSKEPFTIVIPPPNVTGRLHLGHAWDTSIQDMIIRRKRMQGYDALWLPGMDHAGIATQAKVDEKLRKMGISRYDIGREKFLEIAWDWKKEYANIIREQWKALGLGLDYSKERFTLDEGCSKAVNEVFVSLYNKGLIYRGNRIINWDSQAKTALSNIEVDYKEIKGALYYLKYKIVDSDDFLVVATTRPETMFADQAVMVNPNDQRYKSFIGLKVMIPNTNYIIPIIADEYVDIEFGTGCVKVTPAHDPNDFEVGLRHNLAMPLCMNEDGTMNEMALKYQGMDRFECRKKTLEDLKQSDMLIKIEEHIHNVGHSQRTGIIVEPRLSKQWFVKMEELSLNVLKNDEYRFIPDRFKQTLVHWLSNIQDWCISRQLWWGHRIPAYYKGDEMIVSLQKPDNSYVQDEDVLDTWFSSALWPFSTLGWPENTDLMKRYYPTSVLVTGYDIIFFWVSRMLFTGIEFTGKAPFKDILIHGLIRDSSGQKMSKSLGNGIDPFDVKEKYGIDSLRYFLNTNAAPGLDLRYDEVKIESSWNYLNKIWNIARFIQMNLSDDFKVEPIDVSKINSISKWILAKLNSVISIVDYNYDKYEFGEMAKELYNFTWNDFASWYIELTKVDMQNDDKKNTEQVLYYVLMAIVKMLHPIVPFITEEIYQSLPHEKDSIVIESWPVFNEKFADSRESIYVEEMLDVIKAIRNIRAEANKGLSKPIDIFIATKNETFSAKFDEMKDYIIRLTNPRNLVISTNITTNNECSITVLTNTTIYIPSSDLINKEEIIAKMNEEKIKLEAEIERGEKMLSNQNFISRAKPEKVLEEKEKLAEYKNKYAEILKHLNEMIS